MPSQKKPNRLLCKEEQNVRQKHAEQGRRKIDNWGGQYSYIQVLHN